MRDTMKTPTLQAKTDALRERSGSVTSLDSLVMFLYLLTRDRLPVGAVETLLGQIEILDWTTEAHFTNGWLATWAKDAAARLRTDT